MFSLVTVEFLFFVYIECSTSNPSNSYVNRCAATTEISGVVATPYSGTVILTRNGTYSKSYTSGRVVVYGIGPSTSLSLFWGNVCRYSSFSTAAADVICQQLTYTGATSWGYTAIDKLATLILHCIFVY